MSYGSFVTFETSRAVLNDEHDIVAQWWIEPDEPVLILEQWERRTENLPMCKTTKSTWARVLTARGVGIIQVKSYEHWC